MNFNFKAAVVEIRRAGKDDITAIVNIAFPAWDTTYRGKIVSEEQFDFMFNEMYSLESLSNQMDNGHKFFILSENSYPAAFISFTSEGSTIRIPKLYVHPSHHKKGFGRILLNKIEEMHRGKFDYLELNVNRFNLAKNFYEKLGFEVSSEIDVPIGKFFMNDYIMKKKI